MRLLVERSGDEPGYFRWMHDLCGPCAAAFRLREAGRLLGWRQTEKDPKKTFSEAEFRGRPGLIFR